MTWVCTNELMSNETIVDADKIYSTGLPPLDQRLGGATSEKFGIPGGSLVLVLTPPESNLSTLFAQRVLINLLELNENSIVYYIHSSRPQHIVRKEFKAYNWDIDKYIQQERFQFIDMWHITSSHVASSSRIGQIDIRRKTYLKDTYRKIVQVRENSNSPCFTVVDNLLWLKEEEFDLQASKILDFFKQITDLIQRIGGVHFLILPVGILSKTAENMISSTVSGIIEFDRQTLGNRKQDTIAIVKMMGVAYKSEILDITPDEVDGLRIESTGKI